MNDRNQRAIGYFPFGESVNTLSQLDCTPKKVFVLGVYASAVHARWVSRDGKELVRALAVASEPYIFWKGDGAEEIVGRIAIPDELGLLEPADPAFNGPSGKALDELFLNPLGVRRENAWLCDLVPHSCVNPGQKKAIERVYLPLAEKYNLPQPSVPVLPALLTDEKRRQEIVAELEASTANILLLLGDLPIKWFLRNFDDRWRSLADFGRSADAYGELHELVLLGRKIAVLPLVHPRQAGRLGASSQVWGELHAGWMQSRAGKLL